MYGSGRKHVNIEVALNNPKVLRPKKVIKWTFEQLLEYDYKLAPKDIMSLESWKNLVNAYCVYPDSSYLSLHESVLSHFRGLFPTTIVNGFTDIFEMKISIKYLLDSVSHFWSPDFLLIDTIYQKIASYLNNIKVRNFRSFKFVELSIKARKHS